MLYYQYPPASSSSSPVLGMRLQKLETAVLDNVSAGESYIKRTGIVVPNDHFLKRLLGVLDAYSGATPDETYDNVDINTETIANLLGITNRKDSGRTHEILGYNDIVVVSKVDSRPIFNAVTSRVQMSEFQLITHQWDDNNPMGYLSPKVGTAVFVINLPLLAARWHFLRSQDDPVSANKFITDLFAKWVRPALVNACFNSVQYWVNDEESFYYETRAPFLVRDINTLGKDALSDIKSFYHNFKNKSVGNLVETLFILGLNRHRTVVDLKDFYVDNMQWAGLYMDKLFFNRIAGLDGMFDLGLDLTTVERSSRRMTNNARLSQLLRVAPIGAALTVSAVYG